MIILFHEVVTHSVRGEHYTLKFTLAFLYSGLHETVRVFRIRKNQDFRGLRLKENPIRNTLTEATVTERRRGDIPNRCGMHP